MGLPGGRGSGPEQDQIGLRGVVFAQDDGVLHVDDGDVAERPGEEAVEAPDAARVAVADGRHLDDLAGDELDPVVLGSR